MERLFGGRIAMRVPEREDAGAFLRFWGDHISEA
jgi:hypothetical protein